MKPSTGMLKSESLKSYWDDAWQGRRPEVYGGPVFDAHPILKKHLPFNPHFSCLEIGCVPGNWLVYLNREFGYQVFGIDNSEATELAKATLDINGVKGTIWQGDAFSFPFTCEFDVVYSGGFVEHFDDYHGVLKMHSRLVKSGGYLVISVPNLYGLHGFLLKRLDRPQFDRHRLELTKAGRIADILRGDFDILFSNYCLTYRPFYTLPRPLSVISRCVVKLLRTLRLQRIPNRWLSPHQWVVAKKH